MPNHGPKIHYLPDDDYYVIYPRHLFCGGWMLKPKTTNNMNDVTCGRCLDIIARAMFGKDKRVKNDLRNEKQT